MFLRKGISFRSAARDRFLVSDGEQARTRWNTFPVHPLAYPPPRSPTRTK